MISRRSLLAAATGVILPELRSPSSSWQTTEEAFNCGSPASTCYLGRPIEFWIKELCQPGALRDWRPIEAVSAFGETALPYLIFAAEEANREILGRFVFASLRTGILAPQFIAGLLYTRRNDRFFADDWKMVVEHLPHWRDGGLLATQCMIDALRSDVPKVQIAAAKTLKWHNAADTKINKELLDVATGDCIEVARMGVVALRRRLPPASEVWVDLARHHDVFVQAVAATALVADDSQKRHMWRCLENVLASEDHMLIVLICQELTRLAWKSHVIRRRLLRLLADVRADVRAAAAEALGSDQDKRTLAPLLHIAREDQASHVRRAASFALHRRKVVLPSTIVTNWLSQSDPLVRADGYRVLGRMCCTSEIAHHALKDFAHESQVVRLAAARAAGAAQCGSVNRFTELLRHQDARVREAAVTAMAEVGLGKTAMAWSVAHLVNDESRDVREAAITSLVHARVGQQVVVPILAEMLRAGTEEDCLFAASRLVWNLDWGMPTLLEAAESNELLIRATSIAWLADSVSLIPDSFVASAREVAIRLTADRDLAVSSEACKLLRGVRGRFPGNEVGPPDANNV